MDAELLMIIKDILLALFGVGMFILGYNTAAPSSKKIAARKPKQEKTEAEIMLERIEKAHL